MRATPTRGAAVPYPPVPQIRVRGVWIAALLLGVSQPACTPRTEVPSSRPNVIIYLVDTLRKDHLSVYGYPHETSPRLAEFAADAVRFETTYSPTSWTRPAVASLLSGVAPHRHGAISRPDHVAPDVRLLPEYLRAGGYHTRAFVTNPNVLPVWGFGRGFDAFHDVPGTGDAARADEINEAVFESLRRESSTPFFLYVHTMDPHAPWDPPPHIRASFPRASATDLESSDPAVAARARLTNMVGDYDAEILSNDRSFGELLDFLRSEALYDDTLVIFTSDHGEELRDHGQVGHGLTLFQEAVQVPLLVKFPAQAHAGSVVHTPASLLDVLPTVLRLAGAAPAAGVEGVDLLELMRAERSGRTEGRPFFLDLDLAGVTVERNVASGVVWGGYKLVELAEPRAGVLMFDLLGDPLERRNLSRRRRALAVRLRQQLAEYRESDEVGVHLWLVNASDQVARVVEGALRVEGRFGALRLRQLESDDEARIAADERRLVFRVELHNRPNPIEEPPLWLVDQDRLVFSVHPPDARIEIESLTIDGATAPLFLGADARRAGLPLVLDPTSADLRVARMTSLFPTTQEASSVAPLGAYLGVVQREEGATVVLDPAVEERLRTLGYAN